MEPVRVRFAPSPTGPLHIGGVRTALYNYLFAKKNGGTFILRIEDTDQTRFVEGAKQYIIDSLEWCGIKIDEGTGKLGGNRISTYTQSRKKHEYHKYALKLIDQGDAYYAFDSTETLDKLRLAKEKEHDTFVYNASIRKLLINSLSLPESEWKTKISSGIPYVIRYRMPENEPLEFNDLIRGNIVVNTSTLDDKILFKSDGMPTYHLAHIVDDHVMKISHVIRGEEWLPSLPLHVMMYKSFGWEPPLFAHLPLLLKPDGKGKLSKRDGDKMGFPVYPLFWPYGDTAKGFKSEGYYPEAFVNMLALLGWNPGTEQEIFSMEELIEAFSLDRVGKSGSRFDPEKAKWFNHQYLQKKSIDELTYEFKDYVWKNGGDDNIPKLEELVAMVKERVSFVKDIQEQTEFFFKVPETYDQEAVKKRWNKDSAGLLMELKSLLENMVDFSASATEPVIKDWIEKKGYNMGAVMNAFRLVIVGALRGPHMFDIISWIGKEETIKRISTGVALLSK